MQDLPKLRQLDGQEVSKTERQEAGYRISSEEEGDADFDENEEEEEEEEEDVRKSMITPGYSINGMLVFLHELFF